MLGIGLALGLEQTLGLGPRKTGLGLVMLEMLAPGLGQMEVGLGLVLSMVLLQHQHQGS